MKLDVTEKDIHLLASAMQQMADDLAAMAEDLLRGERGALPEAQCPLAHAEGSQDGLREHLFWMRDSEQKFRELTV